MSDTINYDERIGHTTYRGFATTKKDLRRQLDWQNTHNDNHVAWCPACHAVVAVESHLMAYGLTDMCAWCYSEIKGKYGLVKGNH